MTCKCVPCSECNGSGSVWFSFSGKYLGNHRSDDLDELVTCEVCSGSGLDEMCDECREKEEEAEYREWQEQEAAEHGVHPTGLTAAQKEEVLQIVESAIKKGSV